MIHLLITLVVFVAVMGMASVLFSGWVLVKLFRGVRWLVMPRRPAFDGRIGNARACENERCRLSNPPSSRFCRRCGRSLARGVALERDGLPLGPVHAVQ